MEMNHNLLPVRANHTFGPVAIFDRFLPWRKRADAKKPTASLKMRLADLIFVLSGEIVNLKQGCLNEDAQELGYQWRKCTIALLDCRKALRKAHHTATKEGLHKEYLALKEQHRLLRKSFRARESQSYAPIQAHLKQLRGIKIRIANASAGTSSSLRIEFYRILTEAKEIARRGVRASRNYSCG